MGQTRILAIGEVGDKTGGDRPREHCTYIRALFIIGTEAAYTDTQRLHYVYWARNVWLELLLFMVQQYETNV